MNELTRTLILIKPDGYSRGLTGTILQRIEAKGYTLKALSVVNASEEQLASHYAEHVNKPFYPGVRDYMMSGPIVAVIVEGYRVIEGMRSIMGATDPTTAAPGSIRGDLACASSDDTIRNLIHGSDSLESATREIAIWFPELA
ncbi:nucleoside-diphosphate kinase [Actinomyces vulturis]|uniref:nucleoside-diphosphate kinase n=1 Tax=Actinomyces vulturis TaxID=1857645 RepID=UPI00082CF613|nr:nucleoside-diphosphate kinase [Actinomyces vulturis]